MKQLLITIAALVLVGCGPNIDIHEAALNGDLNEIKKHINAGTDLNIKSPFPFEQTPLHLAVIAAHLEIVDVLISNGAQVDPIDADGKSPLFYALQGNLSPRNKFTPKITSALISNGASTDIVDKNGNHPIHNLGVYGKENVEKLDILINAKVNLNVKGKDSKTLLDIVVERFNFINRMAGDDQTDLLSNGVIDLLRKHGGKTGEELKAEKK